MLSIETTTNDDTCVIALSGRLDVKSAKEADSAFADAAETSKNVILDLTDLDYIASAGLRAIKRLRSGVRANSGSLLVRGTQENVMEIFEMTGFSAMLTFE